MARPRIFGLWGVSEIQIRFAEGQRQLSQLLDIGWDENGELYLLTKEPGLGATGNTGVIYRIVPAD